jgi:3-hydroxyacyl-[acyl-carrier-protein] dehydratase
MLNNHFFTINSYQLVENTTDKYTVDITLNPAHPVYQGHFPSNPVAPGVCLMQMVKETAEHILKTPFSIKKADSIKFMAIVNPFEGSHVKLDVQLRLQETGEIKADSSLYSAETIFFKMKSVFAT